MLRYICQDHNHCYTYNADQKRFARFQEEELYPGYIPGSGEV